MLSVDKYYSSVLKTGDHYSNGDLHIMSEAAMIANDQPELSPSANEDDVQMKRKKERKRVFYAIPNSSKFFSSKSKVDLKKQLATAGVELAGVEIVFGEPRKVVSKTDFTF